MRRLHVGVRTGGTAASPVITQIAEFQAPTDTFGLQLLFDASTRATHRMRPQGADFWALSEALGNQTHSPSFRAGAVPQHVPTYGTFWSAVSPSGGGNVGGGNPVCPRCGAEYTKAQATMSAMFGINPVGGGVGTALGIDPTTGQWSPDGTPNQMGYVDRRGCIKSPEAMELCLQPFVNASTTEDILVVDLGDEITVADPNPNHTTPAKFAAWCSANGHAGKPGCGGTVNASIASAKGDLASNAHYYFSTLFTQDVGIARYKALTQTIQSILPRAVIGANFSPIKP